MKIKFIILGIFFLNIVVSNVYGQQIQIEKYRAGYKCMLEDKVLKMNDLVKIMEPNLQASEIIKKAKSTNVAAGIFGGIGGGLLGWTLGGLVGGRAPNIGVVGTGVGFILIGIPIQKNANKKLLQAVDIYNNDLMGFTKPLEKPQYELLVNNNGIGLQLSF